MFALVLCQLFSTTNVDCRFSVWVCEVSSSVHLMEDVLSTPCLLAMPQVTLGQCQLVWHWWDLAHTLSLHLPLPLRLCRLVPLRCVPIVVLHVFNTLTYQTCGTARGPWKGFLLYVSSFHLSMHVCIEVAPAPHLRTCHRWSCWGSRSWRAWRSWTLGGLGDWRSTLLSIWWASNWLRRGQRAFVVTSPMSIDLSFYDVQRWIFQNVIFVRVDLISYTWFERHSHLCELSDRWIFQLLENLIILVWFLWRILCVIADFAFSLILCLSAPARPSRLTAILFLSRRFEASAHRFTHIRLGLQLCQLDFSLQSFEVLLKLFVHLLEVLTVFTRVLVWVTFAEAGHAWNFMVHGVRWDELSRRWACIVAFTSFCIYIHSFASIILIDRIGRDRLHSAERVTVVTFRAICFHRCGFAEYCS